MTLHPNPIFSHSDSGYGVHAAAGTLVGLRIDLAMLPVPPLPESD
jgi:hypothetical protein